MNIPKYVIPLLVIIALFAGYSLRLAFTQPSTSVTFTGSEGVRLVCVVEGVKCQGTANFFTGLYRDVPGIQSVETFASEHKVVFTYDPSTISQEDIRRVMEQEIPLRDGSRRQVFRCLSMK